MRDDRTVDENDISLEAAADPAMRSESPSGRVKVRFVDDPEHRHVSLLEVQRSGASSAATDLGEALFHVRIQAVGPPAPRPPPGVSAQRLQVVEFDGAVIAAHRQSQVCAELEVLLAGHQATLPPQQ